MMFLPKQRERLPTGIRPFFYVTNPIAQGLSVMEAPVYGTFQKSLKGFSPCLATSSQEHAAHIVQGLPRKNICRLQRDYFTFALERPPCFSADSMYQCLLVTFV